MQFIKATIEINVPEQFEKKRDVHFSVADQVGEQLFREHGKSIRITFSSLIETRMMLGIVSFSPTDVPQTLNDYLERLSVEIKSFSVQAEVPIQYQEITFEQWKDLLENAERSHYCKEYYEIMRDMEVESLGRARYEPNDAPHSEGLVLGNACKQDLLKAAGELLCEDTLVPELERIFAGVENPAIKAHPVHYLVQADTLEKARGIADVLLKALLASGRIENQRYVEFLGNPERTFSQKKLDDWYRAGKGGAVLCTYESMENADSEYANTGTEGITRFCDAMLRYRNDVLTIICMTNYSEKLKLLFLERIGTIRLVELDQEALPVARARKYLRQSARNIGLTPDKALYRSISDEDILYRQQDLDKAFEAWSQPKIIEQAYPQYLAYREPDKRALLAKPKGTAYRDLQKMVGLDEAKETIGLAIDFYKAQKLFKEKGMHHERTAMHMVFTGNPGTAKTTVARLFAHIMKDNQVLSVGDLFEVGRGDLVGKYVGHTAPLVKEKFKTAKGSVLFIDEAYSLVDDKEGLFGDEAINTIVQEMENNREDLVVIFAGYPDKMEEFLSRNPGLRSRVAFHVHFDDYNAEELCDIAELIAEGKHRRFDSSVKGQLLSILPSVVKTPDFGNGRFMRNLIEHAELKQARRLLAMEPEVVCEEHILTLTAADFEAPKHQVTKSKPIGFCRDQN
jgi:AAA+ superfamily predicted ATPase